jgi:anti-anti-sigma factor
MDADVRHEVSAILCRGERSIVLDLPGVSDIDAAGVGELVRAYNMAAAVDGALRIARPTSRVREMLEVAGLFELLSRPDAADVTGERIAEQTSR